MRRPSHICVQTGLLSRVLRARNNDSKSHHRLFSLSARFCYRVSPRIHLSLVIRQLMQVRSSPSIRGHNLEPIQCSAARALLSLTEPKWWMGYFKVALCFYHCKIRRIRIVFLSTTPRKPSPGFEGISGGLGHAPVTQMREH